MKILIFGSLCRDVIMDFPDYFKNHLIADKLHILSVSFLVNKLKINFGGTAGNIAYSLSLLGEQPIVIGSAGNDFQEYQEWLRKNKIDISQVKIINKEKTAIAHIITDRADNQITAFYSGAMNYPKKNIKKSFLKNSLAIIAPGNSEDMINFAQIFQKNKVPFIFDPGQQITALSGSDLKKSVKGAKIFISNDYELEIMLSKTKMKKNELLNNVELLITTLGEKGSQIIAKDKTYNIPAANAKAVIDPTGAGDAYRAGLIKGLLLNLEIAGIGRLASLSAVYAVEKYGTQNHQFTLKEFKQRYEKQYNERITDSLIA